MPFITFVINKIILLVPRSHKHFLYTENNEILYICFFLFTILLYWFISEMTEGCSNKYIIESPPMFVFFSKELKEGSSQEGLAITGVSHDLNTHHKV